MGRTEGPDSVPSRPSIRDKRGPGSGPRSSQSRAVLISKALSRLLRHQAQNEGVPITSDGWVRLDHLLAWRGLSSRVGGPSEQPTVEEIWAVVEENEKKRFAVRWAKSEEKKDGSQDTSSHTTVTATAADNTIPPATATAQQSSLSTSQTQPDETMTDAAAVAVESETNQAINTWRSGIDTTPSHYLIRATQGHSIKTIASTNELMTPITLDDSTSIPTSCVHGTFYGAWQHILTSGGLKPMGRNHVHFAMGPPLSQVLPAEGADTEVSEEAKVISGMRHDAQILIYVDLKRCLEDIKTQGAQMEWWRSENDVILTAGIDPATVGVTEVSQEEASEGQGNAKQKRHGPHQSTDNKMVPMKYWTVVVEVRKGLGVLWKQGEGVVKELPPHLAAMGTPKGQRRGGGGGRGGRGGRRG